MKKFGIILMVMAAFCGVMTSCDEVQAVKEPEQGALTLNIFGDIPTKAASTEAQAYEKAVNSLDLYVFEGGSTLYFHERLVPNGTPSDATRLEYAFNATTGAITATVKKLPVSTYTLYMVANVPSSQLSGKTTISAIDGAAITLANCSTTASSGFVMFAKKENISVTGGQTTTVPGEIQLERFASRVRLVSVKNGIPASAAYADNNAVSVTGMFLSNVASAWTIGAAAAPTTATNVRGRKGNDKITPATSVDYPVTLYKPSNATSVAQGATAQIGWSAYGFATTAVLTGATEPKLVVCATVNGTPYYYPVFLIQGTPYPARSGIERNKSYDITVEISGPGSTDPDERVVRGAISATVTVAPWVAGQEWNESI